MSRPPKRPCPGRDRICRHCRRCVVCRPRGLCWVCYQAPGVRDLYPVVSKFARAGVYAFDSRRPPLPPSPTGAVPGTPEKVAVLAGRAAAGWHLYHPLDYVPDARGD